MLVDKQDLITISLFSLPILTIIAGLFVLLPIAYCGSISEAKGYIVSGLAGIISTLVASIVYLLLVFS